MKKGVSMGWLYILLFALTVSFVVVIAVPEEAWPSKSQFLSKIGFDKLKLPSSQPDDCPGLNEKDCSKYVSMGCYPAAEHKTGEFIECRECPPFPTCQMVGNQEACEKEPCGLFCKWAEGDYGEGYTLIGKCVYANILAQFKKELDSLGMKFDSTFTNMEKLSETSQHSVYKSDGNIIVIDKTSRTLYIENALYTISESTIGVHYLDTLEEIAMISLE